MKQISLIILVILFTPIFASAETVLRTGADISVESDQVVEGDYYVSAGFFGRTVMSGSVSEDMYALGASVTVNGEIGKDLTIVSGTAQLHSPVDDDVRIFAGEVTIAEDVGGDVFVLASSLSILSTANIAGDVFFFGGDLVIDGDVQGSVLGKAQTVDISSSIGGDVDMSAINGITLEDTAIIVGSLKYTSLVPLTRGQGAVIEGEVLESQSAVMTTKQQAREILIPIFVTLFATLSLYLLFKKELESIVYSVSSRFSRNLLIGSGISLFGPIVAVLLMVTVLGLFVGILTLSIIVLLYVAGIALSSVVLGAFLMKTVTKRLEVTLITIIVGTVALQLLLFIPVVGYLVLYVIFAVTVGALTQRLYRTVA